MTETPTAIATPTGGPDAPPAPVDAERADEGAPAKRWVAGTLTYTAGSLAALFFFLLWGDFAWALKERAVPPILQLLLKQFKASDLVVATLIGFLPQVMAVVLLPVISYRSDRHRGRWGRRIPYLLLPTPITVMSMVGLAYSPAIGAWLHRTTGTDAVEPATLVLTSFGVFWMIFEFSSTVCQAVFTGLINDVVPREVLGRFYGLFRVFGLAAGMTFNYYLFGGAETHYVAIFLGIAALYGVSFTVMCLRVKEPSYPPHPSLQVRAGQSAERNSFASATAGYLRECFGDRRFLAYYASLALANMAFQPILLFSLYFASSVGMSMERFGKITTFQLFLSLIQAYPLGWLADKFHPLRVTILSVALYALAAFGAFLFARDAESFGIAHVVCGVVAGCWLTATAALAPAILPRDRFAQFNSAAWLCASLGIIVAAPLSGWLLDLTKQRYEYIYLWAGVFATLSLIAIVRLFRRSRL
jgi:MFS family permease